jgi:anti-anti-sigma regulatory factor
VRSQLLEDLNRTIALAEQQRRQILSLSAPTLEVGPSILAVPFIGELSAERTDDVAQRLLPALQSQKSRFVILDFTGCDSVMQEGAAKLAQLVHATRLLGATVVVTGINAQLATTLVRSGTDLGELQTLRQLRDGIEYCRRRIGRLTD